MQVVTAPKNPEINDAGLKVETIAEGLVIPTQFAFLGKDDILVLEKDNGEIRRIVNGTLLPEPFFKANFENDTRTLGCMCGIAVGNSQNGSRYVFLYYYVTNTQDKELAVGNYLIRFDLKNNTMDNPKPTCLYSCKARRTAQWRSNPNRAR